MRVLFAIFLVTAVRAEMNFPPIKSGLWQTTTTGSGTNAVSAICIDEKTNKMLLEGSQDMLKKFCKFKYNYDGKKMEINSNCDMMGMKFTAQSISTGDFASKVKTVTKTSGSSKFIQNMSTTSVSHYKGACPPGMKPGDTTYKDKGSSKTQKMNVKDMKKAMEGLKALDQLKGLKIPQ